MSKHLTGTSGCCPYVLRVKAAHKPRYGACSPLYMEKIKKWKHHFRAVVDQIYLNAISISAPVGFGPMEQYFDGFDCEYYVLDQEEGQPPVDGYYEIVGNSFRIFVATGVSHERQRFTVAHEWMHILQKWDGDFMADMEAIQDPVERLAIMERIAEITASYYLAPPTLVRAAYLKALVYEKDKVLAHLAREFAVSQQMMRICISDYDLEKIET